MPPRSFQPASAETSRIGKTTPPPLRERAGAAVRLWIELFDRHHILSNASAISLQALKALVPLVLFGISLPGVSGLSVVWENQLRESVSRQFTPPVFIAIDTAVAKIMEEGSPALPASSSAPTGWSSARSWRRGRARRGVVRTSDLLRERPRSPG